MIVEQSQVYEKLAALRVKYPDEVAQIQQDEERLTKLLQTDEFYQHPVMQDLLSVCRRDIQRSRMLLATNRDLDDEERDDLWKVIDARLWFVERAAQNYQAELAAMDQELEAALDRA